MIKQRMAQFQRFFRLSNLIAVSIMLFTFPGLVIGQGQYWQLTFSYNPQSLNLVDIGKIPTMLKQVHTPGLTGAPLRIEYNLIWLDKGGKALFSTPAVIPIGIRAVMSANSPCLVIIPDEDVFVVRVPGPSGEMLPYAIHLEKTGIMTPDEKVTEIPKALQFQEITLPLPQHPMQLATGPISATKVRDTGNDSNRLVIVVMGDGYTIANLTAGTFTTHTQNLLNAFLNKSPWDVYFAGTNVYRVDIESNQEGADEPPLGNYVDTYLNATFWTYNIERLLTIDATGRSRAIAAANSLVGTGVWDNIFVLVNSTRYGGSGGSIAVSSVHSAASEIILHEYGHTFAGLADEYEDPYPGYPPGDSEPNVDYDYSGPGLKWLVWVEAGTPLPTPETSEYDTVVGAFEGARYLSTGIYRPWLNCEMSSLYRPFCPVCKQAHAIEYTNIVNLADAVSPPASTTQYVDASGVTFSVTPVPISPITYEWRINENPIPGATSSSITLTSSDIPLGSSILKINIAHPTPLIRSTTIDETYSWNLESTSDVEQHLWNLL